MVDLPPEQFEGELPHPVRTLKFRPRHVPRCFPACGQVPLPTMPCHVGHQRCCLALTPRLRYTFMSHRLQTCKKAASKHPGEGWLIITGPGPSPATRAEERPSCRDEPALVPQGRPVRAPGRHLASRLAGHERPDVRPAGLSATGRPLDRSGCFIRLL